MSRELCSICGGSGEVYRLTSFDPGSGSCELVACSCITGWAPRGSLRLSKEERKAQNKLALERAVAAIEKAFERQCSKTK